MRRMVLCLAVLPALAAAQDLSLPPDALTAEQAEDASFAVPAGPWDDGVERVTTEGRVLRRAWRLEGDARAPVDLAEQVTQRLEGQGYQRRFSCTDLVCGGYDFRFAVPTLPAPAMFVDLGDYAYSLLDGDTGIAAILVSRARGDLYVQLIAGGAADATASMQDGAVPDTGAEGIASPAGATWTTLLREGHVPLDDLTFGTGASALDDGTFASLADLARGLEATPDARLVLVGHTDALGGYEANLDLSRQRAEAVRTALISTHGVSGARLTARGASFLSPRATNATEVGRRANRRVEAVLIR